MNDETQEFEWDSAKAEAYLRKHGIAFEAAQRVFDDLFAVEVPDLDLSYGEVRFVITGMVDGRLLRVVFTERRAVSESSQPARQQGMSKGNTIIARRNPDGTISQVLPDGTTRPLPDRTDWTRVDAMSEEEVEAAAMADADAKPMTPEQLAQAKPVPRVRTLRRALGLTQEEFAARYHIPLGTLRDWEQGRTEPDQPARAYLKVIASNPEEVSRALAGRPR